MDLADQHMWWKQQGGRELRRLLIDVWDPIGVKDSAGAQDEYDGYRSDILRLVREGATAERLAERLSAAQDRMGLPVAANKLLPVSEQLLAWYPASIARWSASRL